MIKIKMVGTGIAVSAVAILLTAGQTWGAPVLGPHQDGDTFAFDGWVGSAADADSVAGDGDAEDSGFTGLGESLAGHTALQIQPDTQGLGVLERDYFKTSNTDLIGDLSGYGAISFDFYSDPDGNPLTDDGGPSMIGAYFHSDFGPGPGDAYWFYTLPGAAVSGGWNNYSFSLTSLTWLGNEGGPLALPNASMSLTDALTQVDEIGFMVAYLSDNSTQIYGVDNFGLTVPEPETYLVLGMALLSVAVVFRKRISDSLAEARAAMLA